MNESVESNYKSEIYEEEKRIIREADNKNRLVIFVGAGASISAGIPSWSQAIDEIREKMNDSIKDSDDFLKVPQYYYNEYGKNNYVALMREIFKYKKNLYPRDIHKKILNFRAKYIITTNYDTLLEQAAEDNCQVIDVISHDKDLAYGIAEKKIIKMHGDFEHDNFVLKEDDYLRYSETFRLIETYVKSLIAGNVVLFLGYSFNDPDLKQIFSWVKEIIGNDKPQSYIINIDENFSLAKFNYFQNFGIKILYASEKIEDYDSKTLDDSKKLEKRLENMIDFLQREPPIEISINGVYQYLRPFMNLNYIYHKYTNKIFVRQQIINEFNNIPFLTPARYNLLKDIFINVDNKTSNISKEEKKLRSIRELLGKNRFRKSPVKFSEEKKESSDFPELPSTISNDVEEICNAIIFNDVQSLNKMKERNQLNLADTNPILYFQQAFILYYLNDYIEAYNLMKRATTCCYRNGMYNWYFLSLLNRKILYEIIFINEAERNWDPELIKNIEQEDEKINLDKTIQLLPDIGNHHNQYLKDLYTFNIFYNLGNEAFSNYFKVKKEAETSYHFHLYPPKFEYFRNQIEDLWYYTTSNFLMLDRCKEHNDVFRIYGMTILENVLTSDKSEKLFDGTTTYNIRPESLDYFDLYLILRYLSFDEIQRIVSKKKCQFIPIDTNSKDYLIEIVSNCKTLPLNQEIISINEISWIKFEDVFWKIIYIISNIELDESLIFVVISELRNRIPFKNTSRNGKEISGFFQSVIRKEILISDANASNSAILSDYLENLLDNTEQILKNILESYLREIFYSGISLYNKITGSKFSSKKLDTIIDLRYINILAIIYPLIDDETKKRIEILTQNCQWEINDDSLYSIYLLTRNNILTINDEIEKNILNYAQTFKDNQKNTIDYQYSRTLQYLTKLYLGDYLNDKGNFEKFIKQNGNDFWELIIDAKNFDYKKFKLEWLKYLPIEFFEKLNSNDDIITIVQSKVREKYFDGSLDDETMEIFFKHFVTKKV